MEEDKLILSLLARVRTWTEERKKYVLWHAGAHSNPQIKDKIVKSEEWKWKDNIREQRCTLTLLSSITVLSDSIHMGSISPSRTIHLGPSCPTEVSSLMVEENRPKVKSKTYSGTSIVFLDCSGTVPITGPKCHMLSFIHLSLLY